MGNSLGVYDDDETGDLSDDELARLRDAIALGLKDLGVLKSFLEKPENQEIRRGLRNHVTSNFPQNAKLKLKDR